MFQAFNKKFESVAIKDRRDTEKAKHMRQHMAAVPQYELPPSRKL